MPIYEYRCEACAEGFELSRSIERRDDAECPQCGSRRVRRLIAAVASHSKSAAGTPAPGCCGAPGG